VLAVLLSYLPYLVFYLFSIVMVFHGPFADFEIEFLGWLLNYLLIGAIWGATLFPRLYGRSRLRFLGNKLKWGDTAADYSFWKFDIGELQFFGQFTGYVLAALLVAYVMVIYAASWAVAIFVEVAIWADSDD
jgi:hypothetical protein